MPRLPSGSILIEPTALSLSNHIELLKSLKPYISELGVLYRPGVVDALIPGINRVVSVALSPYTLIVRSTMHPVSELVGIVGKLAGRYYVVRNDAWVDYVDIPVDSILTALATVAGKGSMCAGSTCISVNDYQGECSEVVLADEEFIYLAGLHGHSSTLFKPGDPLRGHGALIYCNSSQGPQPVLESSLENGSRVYRVKIPPGLTNVFQWIPVAILIGEYLGKHEEAW